MKRDAIVIGAGHNGLVAAARLARAGLSVLVLERRDRVGGLCAREEFHPGYSVPGLLHDDGRLASEVAIGLGLESHGLRLSTELPPVLVPEPDGPGLLLHRSAARAAAELDRHGPDEARAYAAWRATIDRLAPFVRQAVSTSPPPLDPQGLSDGIDLLRRGVELRRLGRRDMTELMRIAPMCVADWLQETFASPRLCEALAAPAVIGTFLGPWSAGSAANLLLHECTASRRIEAGPAGLVDVLSTVASSLGVELRTDAEVGGIRVSGGRVLGVTLADGEAIDAPVVAAGCDPKRTFGELLPAGAVSLRAEQQLRAFRARGTTAKVHLALSAPLEVPARRGEPLEAIRLGGGHVDALERAFDAVKYRRPSDSPHLEVRLPSVSDPGLAPSGHHVASILVSFVPYDVEDGWTDERRDALGERVVERLAEVCPDVRERIVASEVLSPDRIAERYALTGGHVHHGEHALDQLLLMRPAPCAARYATPVGGLYLCGSGSHPGGGVTGLPGWLSAGRILSDREAS